MKHLLSYNVLRVERFRIVAQRVFLPKVCILHVTPKIKRSDVPNFLNIST